MAYESRQFGVLPYLVAYRLDFCKQCFVCVGECLARCLVGSVEHGAVGEDDAYVAQYSVTVGVGAAFHAGGVVGYDAAYHGCLFGGGVGRKDAAVGGENLVYARTSDTRLQGYGLGFVISELMFSLPTSQVFSSISRPSCSYSQPEYPKKNLILP